MTDRLRWEARGEPLAVEGAYVEGEPRHAWTRRLTSERLARLRGARTGDGLVLLGPPEALGWIDGIMYLGRDAAESLLYLPTLQKPAVPAEWLVRLLAGSAPPPYLLLPHRGPISLAQVGPVAAEALLAF